MVPLFLFVLGLIFGSFANVIIDRFPKNEDFVLKRSYCDFCRKKLKARDLIPILSFLILRGRCRFCKGKIHYQYPIVEAISGLVFLGTFLVFKPIGISGYLNWFFWLYITEIIFIVLVSDLKYFFIPDKLIYPSVILAFIYNSSIYPFFLSAFILSGALLFLYLVSSGKWLGLGDVKLAFLVGLLFGLKAFEIFGVAVFAGAIIGLSLIFLKKANLKTALPFGSFLSGSSIFYILFFEKFSFLSILIK